MNPSVKSLLFHLQPLTGYTLYDTLLPTKLSFESNGHFLAEMSIGLGTKL